MRERAGRCRGACQFFISGPRDARIKHRLCATDHDNRRRAFVRTKANISRDGGGFAYALASAEVPDGIRTVAVRWHEPLDGETRDILTQVEPSDDAELVAHQIIGDGGYTVREMHDRTLRQTAVPAALLARVDGGVRTLGHMATLVGALGGGMLANLLGARMALVVSALLLATAALLARSRLTRRS